MAAAGWEPCKRAGNVTKLLMFCAGWLAGCGIPRLEPLLNTLTLASSSSSSPSTYYQKVIKLSEHISSVLLIYNGRQTSWQTFFCSAIVASRRTRTNEPDTWVGSKSEFKWGDLFVWLDTQLSSVCVGGGSSTNVGLQLNDFEGNFFLPRFSSPAPTKHI